MRSVFLAEAAWVNGRELVPKAAVIVEAGVVADIVPQDTLPTGAACEFETHRATLLLPGLINAHSHIEYSSLLGRLPAGTSFVEWLGAIVLEKRALTEEDYEASSREGVRRLLAGGTTTVIDSASTDAPAKALAESPLRYCLLWEVLGGSDECAAPALEQLQTRLKVSRSPRCLGVGVNPHAPYTVGKALRGALRDLLSRRPELHCAWHVGEFPEECQLLESASGALADFFVKAQLPLPFDTPPRTTPVGFLEQEKLLSRCDIAFHLNHFANDEPSRFSPPKAVVHCPGTHAFFGREAFRLEEMVSRGANVCLGTDSLASSDTLSMFEVLRKLARAYPRLSGEELLGMATLAPARSKLLSGAGAALVECAPNTWVGGASQRAPVLSEIQTAEPPRYSQRDALGVIQKGAHADFVDIAVEADLTHGLRPLLVAPDAYVARTYIAGKRTY